MDRSGIEKECDHKWVSNLAYSGEAYCRKCIKWLDISQEEKNKKVKEFISTHLIPIYNQKYVCPELRKEFGEIVDEAEKEYLKDNVSIK